MTPPAIGPAGTVLVPEEVGVAVALVWLGSVEVALVPRLALSTDWIEEYSAALVIGTSPVEVKVEITPPIVVSNA